VQPDRLRRRVRDVDAVTRIPNGTGGDFIDDPGFESVASFDIAAYDDPEAWVRTVAWRVAISRWRRLRNASTAWARHGAPPPLTVKARLARGRRKLAERRHAARRTHLRVGVAVAVAVLVAAGVGTGIGLSSASSPGPSRKIVRSAHGAGSTSTVTTAPAGSSSCPAGSLRLSHSPGDALGHDGVIFRLRAPGASCTITGYPTVVVYSGRFSGFHTQAVPQPVSYLEAVVGKPPVVSLANNNVASAVLGGDSVAGGTCHRITSAVVTVRAGAGLAPVRWRVRFAARTFCGQTDSAGCFARSARATAERKSSPSCGRPVIGPWVPGTELSYPKKDF